MLRRVVIVALVALTSLAAPIPASAAGDWDPDDVPGPFDIRWIGADFTSSTSMAFIVSFYEGFETDALPWRPAYEAEVLVHLQDAISGRLVRRAGGRVAFLWGDLGSSCGASWPSGCSRGIVTFLSPRAVRVVIDTTQSEPGWPFNVSVESHWTTLNGRRAVVPLGGNHPSGFLPRARRRGEARSGTLRVGTHHGPG